MHAVGPDRHAAVPDGGGAQHVHGAVEHPPVGPGQLRVGAAVEPVGQVAGEIGVAEVHQVGVVKRLQGVHQIVGHLHAGVHRHPAKGHLPLPLQQVVGGLGAVVVPLPVVADAGALHHHVAVHPAVEQPEGHVDALHLLQLPLGQKGFGQKMLAPVKFVHHGGQILLCNAEGDYRVGPQSAADLVGEHHVVVAVGAAGGGGGGVHLDLCAAGHALVGPGALHGGGVLLVEMVAPLEGLGVVRQRFQRGDVKGVAAALTGDVAGGGVEANGCAAGRAFILLGAVHPHSSFPPQAADFIVVLLLYRPGGKMSIGAGVSPPLFFIFYLILPAFPAPAGRCRWCPWMRRRRKTGHTGIPARN